MKIPLDDRKDIFTPKFLAVIRFFANFASNYYNL